jgi:hypothetical protein
MTRLIVLTGAPARSTLEWNEDALSSRLAIDGERAFHSSRSSESSSAYSAQWRQVPMRDIHSDIGQQKIDPEPSSFDGPAIFLKTAELTPQYRSQQTSTLMKASGSSASMQTATQDLDDFYDQSLALLDHLTTSQLSEFQSQTTNPNDAPSSDDITQVAPPSPANRIRRVSSFQMTAASLKDVRNIPSAAYLQSIEPQTMTVNLIVGIMAMPPPRILTPRRKWGRQHKVRLMDILVGDDTRAGFEVTIWLSYEPDTTEDLLQQSLLEQKVLKLRPRDIVLLRNVALSAYQGRVYGQSLRRDVTKVDLLYRRQVDDSTEKGLYCAEGLLEPAGSDPVMRKTKSVKEWLVNFVGNDMLGDFGESSRTRQALLPPDTQ